jgi:hypothetical protein
MNQQQYDYPQQQQFSQSPPISLPSERADLLDKIRPTAIIEVIRHKLMGEEEIDGEWIQNPLLKVRALSTRGAWDIATLMTPVSSQNVSLSDLKDNEVRSRALSISKTAQRMCLRNWKEYNIKGTDQLRFVHEIVFSNTFITLKQPQGDKMRKFLSNIASADFSQPEEKSGFNLFRQNLQ